VSRDELPHLLEYWPGALKHQHVPQLRKLTQVRSGDAAVQRVRNREAIWLVLASIVIWLES
jgi:hypothetical protein